MMYDVSLPSDKTLMIRNWSSPMWSIWQYGNGSELMMKRYPGMNRWQGVTTVSESSWRSWTLLTVCHNVVFWCRSLIQNQTFTLTIFNQMNQFAITIMQVFPWNGMECCLITAMNTKQISDVQLDRHRYTMLWFASCWQHVSRLTFLYKILNEYVAVPMNQLDLVLSDRPGTHHLLPPQRNVRTASSLRTRGHNFTLPQTDSV